ncbi:hypothetical protein [Streptantibioticus rubrisoli]|uniref:Syndecan 1 n=1 Tax=Streptantibioticus rubrisoli TaxID=1387313 RepID=A0ABT1PLH8_9ACTN|nr:hypothetical protein [Streptantibioticus rubrisoli]MCQ4045103.1 hypothetical protein [Streptantibioticus rubrisoli]
MHTALPAVRSPLAARDPAPLDQGSAHPSGAGTVPGVRAPHRTPVVRPAPPVAPTATAPVQRLPIATAPPTTVPRFPDAGAPDAPNPHGRPTAPFKAAASAAAIQRTPEEGGATDVPVRSAPPRSRIPVPVKKSSSSAEKSPVPPQHGDGIDVEDLARRLIDPVARLLRADLRRGRERAGRLYDGRR